MKLLRSELAGGIQHKLFDIPTKSLVLEGLNFYENSIRCEITSEPIPDGFKLIGIISIPFIEICDRCLEDYRRACSAEFELWLTANEQLISATEADIIWFPYSMEEIDLNPVFHDLVALEEPMKKLCKEDCQGLCPHCGTNKNKHTCTCEVQQGNNPWGALEKLIR